MFLVGLETDVSLILRAGKKAYSVALAGIFVALPTGFGLFHLLRPKASMAGHGGDLLWGIALSCTNFQELARILAEVKLLRSEVGRTALTSSLITDLSSWILLVLAQATLETQRMYITLSSTIVFTIFLVFAVRPALKRVISKEDNNYNDFHVCCVLTGVLLCGFISDACGVLPIAGVFMLGVIMPKGELKDMLMERIEDFVSGFMMPLFFIVIGLRTSLNQMAYQTTLGQTLLVIGLACAPKILSTCLVSLFYSMSALDGLALGLLMTTKGLLSFIVLNSGRTRRVCIYCAFILKSSKFYFVMIS
jgi:Kef-type K+ transport system membrane component KefB